MKDNFMPYDSTLIRTAADESDRSSDLSIFDKSLTQQQFAAECNINNIVKQAEKSGFISSSNPRPGYYGDVSSVASYQEALAIVQEAHDTFTQLPGNVRARFANDPSNLLIFLSDPNNREEAIKLGFIDLPRDDSSLDVKPNQDAK